MGLYLPLALQRPPREAKQVPWLGDEVFWPEMQPVAQGYEGTAEACRKGRMGVDAVQSTSCCWPDMEFPRGCQNPRSRR